MDLNEKVERSLDIIGGCLAQAERPVTLWSAGKDSQVLLDLMRRARAARGESTEGLEVLSFAESFQQERLHFTRQMTREWRLRVHTLQPIEMDAMAWAGEIEIINIFAVGESATIYLPIGIDRLLDERNCECGIEVVNKPKTTATAYPWDVTFIGHKSADVDPIHGAIPVKEISARLGATLMVYPLRDWTDEDVWEYTLARDVPYNTARYDAADDFSEYPDKSGNPDYYQICTRCFDPAQPRTVKCPKLGQRIESIAPYIDYRAKRLSWQSKFINLSLPKKETA